MTIDRPVFHYMRLVLEALTPHGIHSGRGDTTHDVLLLRDANGLPTIPASSLAGVLRHLYQQHFGEAETQALFGYADGDIGQPSALTLTWGLVHDGHNQPMEGLRSDIDEDPLLQFLAQDKPLVRQRVRLNGKGTATDMGKFDTTHIPAGVRYSCFISLWSDGSAAQDAGVERLLGLLQLPNFRIGHSTRGGQGAFKTQAIHSARWDLRTTEGRNSYCARPRQRADVGNLQATNLPAPATNSLTVTLELTAEAGWRIGGGEQAFSQADANGRTPDLLPQSETTIQWDAKQNASLLQQQAVVPASAIKGALSHRTAYHYSCLTSRFADEAAGDNHLECPAVRFLFGHATGNETDEAGAAGRIIINDLYLSAPKTTRQMHNRIDQFTGGVITGALFEEELLWQTPLTLQIHLLDPALTPTLVRQAFALTLNDLTQGWLPLGAGGSRGQGCFLGELKWSDTTWPTAQQELV